MGPINSFTVILETSCFWVYLKGLIFFLRSNKKQNEILVEEGTPDYYGLRMLYIKYYWNSESGKFAKIKSW